MLKELPIGNQSFEKLINRNCLYVDKTALIYKLIMEGTVYFLSRPRRFGKSLLCSTLEAIFQGKRELFAGLWIDQSDYDWTPVPTIRLDMSMVDGDSAETINKSIIRLLIQQAEHHQVVLTIFDSPGQTLAELITLISKNCRVAVLIDEYDKPLLDVLQNEQSTMHPKAMQEILKNFYGVLKAKDANIRFLLLTGVSKFTRISVFSELNHLSDISMTEKYAGLLGYTQEEFVHYFSDRIDLLAQKEKTTQNEILEKIRHWYNGYRFDPDGPSVYNPFSTLLLFDQMKFKAHWFETGTPTFLVNLLANQYQVSANLENIELGESAFTAFDITQLAVLPILYQTGYITIKSYDPETELYTMGYPNDEVRKAFTKVLIQHFSAQSPGQTELQILQLRNTILADDLSGFFDHMKIILSGIPYTIQPPAVDQFDTEGKSEADIKGEIDIRTRQREYYYQSLFYLIFSLMNVRPQAEYATNLGRIDCTVETASTIYLFEFKLDRSTDDAIQQMIKNKYAEGFRYLKKPIQLIGVAFDTKERNIGDWQMISATPIN